MAFNWGSFAQIFGSLVAGGSKIAGGAAQKKALSDAGSQSELVALMQRGILNKQMQYNRSLEQSQIKKQNTAFDIQKAGLKNQQQQSETAQNRALSNQDMQQRFQRINNNPNLRANAFQGLRSQRLGGR